MFIVLLGFYCYVNLYFKMANVLTCASTVSEGQNCCKADTAQLRTLPNDTNHNNYRFLLNGTPERLLLLVMVYKFTFISALL